MTRRWALEGSVLKEGAPTNTGRLSIETIAGAEWVLKSWAWDEAAPATPEVTLKLDGARLVGSAGCNNYFAPVKPGDVPGRHQRRAGRHDAEDVPRAGDGRRDEIPAPTERRDATALRRRQLALSYAREDGTFGVMLFDRRAAR